MLAIIAAVLFLIALIFQLAGITLSVLTVPVLVIAGLLCLALHMAGIGSRSRVGRL
jgi:hypothetical protein